MTRPAKLSPVDAFCANMTDAHHLVRMAEALTSQRARGARREIRERIGVAMRFRKKDWDRIDVLESPDVWLVFKPDSRLSRDQLLDHKPLLRQALVAGCAATETYLSDKAISRLATLTSSESAAPKRLKDLPMTVGDWLYVEQHYKYRRRGLHERVVKAHVAEFASTDPSKVGALMSLLGVSNWSRQLDHHRGVGRGESEAMLDRIAKRRNKIVHTGDRQGLGRATITVKEVPRDLAALESVVAAIEKLLV